MQCMYVCVNVCVCECMYVCVYASSVCVCCSHPTYIFICRRIHSVAPRQHSTGKEQPMGSYQQKIYLFLRSISLICIEYSEYDEYLILFIFSFLFNSIFMCCVVARLIDEIFETEKKKGNK